MGSFPPISLRSGFLSLFAAVLCASHASAIDTVVVFNEVHYHPADGAAGPEFVEFFNQNSVNTDMSGWRISGGIDFAFPEGTVIAGGGYLVVAANPGALAAAGGPAGALGPFTGILDNGGEVMRLRNNNDRVMDELAYNDRKPWPVGADGSGASLSKIAPLKPSDLAENWTHSLATGGTPGVANFGGTASSPGGNVALGKAVIDGSSAYNGQPFNVGTFSAQNVTDGSVSDVFGVSYWLGTDSVPSQYFTLDLGQSYAITEIRLRNTHNTQFNDRGTLGFRMFSSASVNGSNQLVSPQQILSGTLARVDGQDPIPAVTFAAANGLAATTARYLRFESLTAVNNNAGLNEIEVYTATGPPVAVPEDLPLWINEVAGTADGSFWVEIYNAGNVAINLEGYVLTFEDAGEYPFPAGTSIAAGDRLLISSATLALPLPPVDGENLYLYQPGKVSLLDAVRLNDLGIGRVPDGGADLFTIGLPAEQTPGTANAVSIPDAVVINEIMYHHRPQYAEAGDPPSVTTKGGFGWNAPWRYNEAGLDLGANWANSSHGVGGDWKGGAGPLGYETTAGHPPEPIVTQLTNPTLNTTRVITYYFETDFVVAAGDLPNITALHFSHETDDGAIYYLNGQELSPRYDMPSGPVTASTLALNLTATDANAIRFFSVSPTFLVAGSNRLSVEVHQSAVNSSDVVMGLRLDLELTAPGPTPPVVYAEDPEEWVELYNRSGSPVDLGGWELDRAVSYTFPDGTQLAAGGYLVVARDLAAFMAKHPGVQAVGNYAGSISNSGERLLLLDPFNNPVDEVAYFDDKPWPSAADGGGSSLELRHPGIDNNLAASWAASDNSASSSWRNYQYTLTAKDQLAWNSPPTNGFHELRLGLIEEGEVLIDDLSVVEAPGGANLELIANGTFNTTTGWRLLGTHQDSRVFNDGTGNALRIVATDSFNYLNNLIESNLTSGGVLRPVQNGTDYRVSFRAKWLSGSPQFRFELYYNKVAKLVVLDQPVAHGTPGARNSAYSTALGPDLAGLIHSPAVPTASQPVTVRVRATDPDGVGTMTLRYAVNGGAFQSAAMSGAGGAFYQGTIPAQANNAVVQFYVEARDSSAGTNLSYAPPRGPDSRALIRVATPTTGGLKQSLRLNMLASEVSKMHTLAEILDNKRRGCTIITDESDIAYDCGLRLRGSMFSRQDATSTGLNLKFPADQAYRGLHSTVTVRTGNRKEILVKHIINAAGGIHDNYNDIVYLNGYASGPNGRARMEMTRFGTTYLDGLPGGNGTDGTVYKMEGIRVFQATQDGTKNTPKLPQPIGWVSNFDLADQGPDPEIYRHNIRISTALARDDYRDVMEMCQLFSLSGQALEDAAPSVIDVDRWCRQFAALSLCGIGDTYSQGNPHNLNFYARPDGIVEPMPWDWDFTFNRSTSSPLWGDGNLSKLFARPVFGRLFRGHLHDLVNTTYNASYLTGWFNHLGSVSGESYAGDISYVTNRGNFVLSQLPAQIPFALTTNGGANFSVDASTVTLTGDGWINVREVYVNGAPAPLPVTWLDADSWQVEVPIAPGANALTLSAVDFQGNAAGSDMITVTNTGSVVPAAAGNLVVSEIHYHPSGDLAEEFIELQNIHPTAPIDLSGVAFVNGIAFEFPAGTRMAPGARLLLVQDLAAFGARYGAGRPVAGIFQITTRLSNSGERLRLEAPGGIAIRDFSYSDQHPWPQSPDGAGASLVLVAPASNPDHGVATNWRPSVAFGGNPGTGDATTFSGGDFVGYALRGGATSAEIDAGGHLVFSYPRNLAADDVLYVVQFSADLLTWTDDPAVIAFASTDDLGNGMATVRYRATVAAESSPRWFLRLSLKERP